MNLVGYENAKQTCTYSVEDNVIAKKYFSFERLALNILGAILPPIGKIVRNNMNIVAVTVMVHFVFLY